MTTLDSFCCFCFSRNVKLEKIENLEYEKSPFSKIITETVRDLDFSDLDRVLAICEICIRRFCDVYDFHKSCLKNNRLLMGYVDEKRALGGCIDDFSIDFDDFFRIQDDPNASSIKKETINEDFGIFETEKVEILDEMIVGEEVILDSTEDGFEKKPAADFDPLLVSEDIKEELDEDSSSEASPDIEEQIFANIVSKDQDEGEVSHEESFECKLCNIIFTDEADAQQHIHVQTKRFKCSVCKQGFHSLSILLKHLSNHEKRTRSSYRLDKKASPEMKNYKCNICDKLFKTEQSMLQHFAIHTGERRYKCEVCHKSFNQVSSLRNHNLNHTGEKPFKCNLCEKSFKTKNVLKNHMIIHTGERPFKCNVCDKAFYSAGNLKTHNYIHTGEKPYRCSICPRAFYTSSHLKSHYLIHTTGDERPFACDICGKGFKQLVHLKMHEKMHRRQKK